MKKTLLMIALVSGMSAVAGDSYEHHMKQFARRDALEQKARAGNLTPAERAELQKLRQQHTVAI